MENTGERKTGGTGGDGDGREAETDVRENDSALISAILLEGESESRQDAYKLLVERYWKVVVVTLKTRLPTGSDSDSLAQEVFLRAFRSLGKLTNPKAFAGWLLRITQNLATDQLRKHHKTTSLDSLGPDFIESRPATSRSQTDAETLVETEDEMEKVMAAITKLPERYQTVLILRYLKGLSNKEISMNLAEPDGTIRNRLFRALDKLRTLLRKTPVSGAKGNPSRERKTGSIQ